ncbi:MULTISPECIES: F0F1 ATP synthase subunit epsilon [unclassified Microbacterium]|uniref:F0F1 ATP synthase subunit epsilon n=1 Tax=unclassified Microbacterium TaxID=2609290 RepID=UPI00097F4D2F|nr:F0F1 ATP synthase subunit epsilon [Microbacterium sp. JB110]RCS57753.1 F0F1 ATP synthase subunit epsilon [Microbacterium sp. JB110]SJM67844.1 ATP synthase epsilon chain [Frigoribacterium sp. JB110]
MSLQVSLVSAEEEVWTGEATLVVATTTEGQIGFMTDHEPVLAILGDGPVRITQEDDSVVTATAKDGFVSVESNRVTIVAGHAAIAS